VLRLGNRPLTPEEMMEFSVPGTILFADEQILAPPAAPPMLPVVCFPWYDPVAGPRPPLEECIPNGCINPPPPQYLRDGRPMRPGFDNDGNLQGLHPTDTVAEYRDAHGRKSLVASNRCCICVPRFGVLRQDLGLGLLDGLARLDDRRDVRGQELVRARVPSLQADQVEQPFRAIGRARPTNMIGTETLITVKRLELIDAHHLDIGPLELLGTNRAHLLREIERLELLKQMEFARALTQKTGLDEFDAVVRTSVVGRYVGGPEVVVGTAETRDLTVCCNEAPCPPEKPLVLIKCADKHAAQPGEIVTFTLKYSNHGGRPMTDIAVTDSLSPRLEYVPGSSEADRDAVFTTQDNEAGSQILRWEISGTLQAGDSGVIRFKAKVR
jgi:uncharacterized repeat protein (TIGR01451 family)